MDFLIKNGGSFHSFCESLPEARKTWKPGKQAFLLVTEGWALAMSLRVHFVKKKSGSVDLKIGYHGIKWYIMVSISQILGDFNGKLYPQMVILMGNYNHSDTTPKKDMFMINIILNI